MLMLMLMRHTSSSSCEHTYYCNNNNSSLISIVPHSCNFRGQLTLGELTMVPVYGRYVQNLVGGKFVANLPRFCRGSR